MNNTYNLENITQKSYKTLLWDYLKTDNIDKYKKIIDDGNHEKLALFLNYDAATSLSDKINNLSLVRKEGSLIQTFKDSDILIYSHNNFEAMWNISKDKDLYEQEILLDEKKIKYEFKSLSSLLKVEEDLFYDRFSNIEEIILNSFAKTFSKAEDLAFISGDGNGEMLGITKDVEIESLVANSNLSLDDVKKLFFSLDSTYRENAKWLMNDKTALYLQTLKDNNGAYLWNTNDNNFMGKEVLISNHMPDIGAGNTAIAFGDFSNYVLLERIKELEKEIQESNEKELNVDSFLKLVRKYTDIKELDPEIIRVFVDKIYVDQSEKIPGSRLKKQTVWIHWNFIGKVEI